MMTEAARTRNEIRTRKKQQRGGGSLAATYPDTNETISKIGRKNNNGEAKLTSPVGERRPHETDTAAKIPFLLSLSSHEAKYST